VLAALTDHLWQSIVSGAVIGCLAWLARRSSAALRLWLWRIAALKFLLPFALLYALGGWLGFPVRHSAVPPPATVVEFFAQGFPLVAPAQAGLFPAYWMIVGLVLALTMAVVCIAVILRELRLSRQRRDEEQARIEADWQYRPVPLGFFPAIALTSVALCMTTIPVISGALADRQWRQKVLAIDTVSLQSAFIEMSEARPGGGILARVSANENGVSIGNINIQDLVAMVYGIDKFEVFGGALPWLEWPRYDVRVYGPVRSPPVFDPYSLRQPVTNYLHDRFGASIRVNGDCQEPCGDHESLHIERLPRCASPLSSHLCHQ
jgi:hypothetical protein